jgi:hypothetical protein
MSAHLRSMRTNGECRAKYASAELAKLAEVVEKILPKKI